MLLHTLKNHLKNQYRHGQRFRQHYKLLQRFQNARPEEVRQMQDEAFRKLIRFCYRHVPYYQAQLDALGLTPDDFQGLQDLTRLPLMDKHQARANLEDLRAKTILSVLHQNGYSSGTTGTPVRLYRDYNAINFENAAIWCYWNQAGDQENRRITLRGEIVVDPEDAHAQAEGPFWRLNPVNQELVLSSYHLNQANFAQYMAQIEAFQPETLYCYPSTGLLLARLFESNGIHYPFKRIFTSSEVLPDDYRDTMEQVFQGKVFDWYGQAERVAALFNCAHGNYHIHEGYSYVELIPAENGLYELVGSNLNNFAMPLLRYRTYDLVELPEPGYQCPCGSSYRVIRNLVGRKPNYIMTPDGRMIGNAPSNILKGVDHILEVQFHQRTPDAIQLYVVPTQGYSAETRQKLIKNTQKYTSAQLQVEVIEVDHITRGPNGKFSNLISELV